MNPKYLAKTNEFTKAKMLKNGFTYEKQKDFHGVTRNRFYKGIDEDIAINIYVTEVRNNEYEINLIIRRGVTSGELNWYIQTYAQYENILNTLI